MTERAVTKQKLHLNYMFLMLPQRGEPKVVYRHAKASLLREGDRTAPKMMRSIGFGARVVEGVSRLSLIISKKLVIVRFNSFRHLLHLMLRKCHLPREGGLGYFIDTLRWARPSFSLYHQFFPHLRQHFCRVARGHSYIRILLRRKLACRPRKVCTESDCAR